MRTKYNVAQHFLLSAFCFPLSVLAQGTAFTYQGRLNDGSGPATGIYDLRFAVYDAATAGTQQGPLVANAATPISNGVFTVTLDFGNQFPGADRWLEIGVRTNGGAAFAVLEPRQPLTATPYAVFAQGASSLPGLTVQPNASSGAPNMIGGSSANFVSSGVVAATIAGGGATNYGGNTVSNSVTANFGTVSGGGNNTVSGPYSVVAGGSNNTASGTADVVGGGLNNQANSANSSTTDAFGHVFNGTVAGGSYNVATNGGATVGGGRRNAAGGSLATVAGGFLNIASGENAAICGGEQNQALGVFSFVGGGFENIASGFRAATVSGGEGNTASGLAATVSGGYFNTASGNYSFAAGYGAQSLQQGTFVWADTSGGSFSSTAANQFLIRASGGVGIGTATPTRPLQVTANNLGALTYPLKVSNEGTTPGTSVGLLFQVDSGGDRGKGALVYERKDTWNRGSIHFLQNPDATAAVTDLSNAVFTIANNGNVGIGTTNPGVTLAINSGSTAFTGVDLFNATTPDGRSGYRLQVVGSDYPSRAGSLELWKMPGPNLLTFTTNGNVGIGTTSPSQQLHVIGNILASGTVTGSSDRNAKEDFVPVDPREVLAKVAELPISRWRYKSEADVTHLGPMAQDFYAAFTVGPDERHISMVDADGVALAAIQGLNEKVESGKQREETRIEKLEAENAELKARLDKLERLIGGQNGDSR
jgi:hypothetical protein